MIALFSINFIAPPCEKKIIAASTTMGRQQKLKQYLTLRRCVDPHAGSPHIRYWNKGLDVWPRPAGYCPRVETHGHVDGSGWTRKVQSLQTNTGFESTEVAPTSPSDRAVVHPVRSRLAA